MIIHHYVYMIFLYSFVNLLKTSPFLRRTTAVNEMIFFLGNSASNSRPVKNENMKIKVKNGKKAKKSCLFSPFCSFAKHFRLGLDGFYLLRLQSLCLSISLVSFHIKTGYWVCLLQEVVFCHLRGFYHLRGVFCQ